MAQLATIYQNIADILSLETLNSDLETTLSHPSFNWDDIVVEGSKHLVLPAIYCRLQQKQLTHLLPNELNTYLAEITLINKNRNLEVINQIKYLSDTLNSHNIKHVFLKGAALIASNFYDNVAERMLGDIDILIAENQLELAFDLLIRDGYVPKKQTLGFNFFEYKHLPRLSSKENIAAVELHKKLFISFKDDELSNANILSNKQSINNIWAPSFEHLTRHNILNFQVNDKGDLYNSINFRATYDTLLLMKEINYELRSKNIKSIRKHINIISLFFNDLSALNPKKTIITWFYLFKLRHIKFYKFWNKLLTRANFLRIIFGRIPHFLFNRAYRSAILHDRRRIFRYFRSVFE